MVDEDSGFCTALAELLREEGYRVDTVLDGSRALPLIAALPPDLILADVTTPRTGDANFLEVVRARHEDIAVVAMTGSGAVDTYIGVLKRGAAGCLTKPLNTAELLLVVERELERQRMRRELASLRARLAHPAAAAGDGVRIPGSTLDELERYAILKTLESTGGSNSKAAAVLGISVRKIQYKLHEYQIHGKGDDKSGTHTPAPDRPKSV